MRVFVLPPSGEALESASRAALRIRARCRRRRMAAASAEISHWAEYDYVIVNADLAESSAALRSILAAERLRRDRMTGLSSFVRTLNRRSPRCGSSSKSPITRRNPNPSSRGFPDACRSRPRRSAKRDGDLVIPLVADADEFVLGYAALSRMTAPMKALGLGPVAVAAARQKQGIGGKLIREGIAQAKADGWEAIFVLGDPAYYGRFGFSPANAEGFASPYAGPYFMALSLSGEALARVGRVDYAPAFRDLE